VHFWGIEHTREERLARAEAAGRRWDRSSVAIALRDRRWEAAKFHLDRLVVAEPQLPSWRARRGEALAAQGRFDEAIDDFDRVAGAGQEQATSYFRALCRAARGDRAGYQSVCRRVFEALGSAPRSALANEVAWTCCLRPDSGVDPAAVADLAEGAVRLDPNNLEALNTLGLALFRAGRHEQAAARLRESIARRDKTGIAEDWLILAMAEHRLGQHDDARRSFERATALERAEPAEGRRSPHWSRRLSWDLLRAEAAELLGPGRP
jgi:tetratricopeptide (TPR) repeat protein